MSTDPSPELPDVRQRFAQLYREMRAVASRMLGKQPPQTLTPSGLTHEAFIKLSAEEARRRTNDRSELAAKPDSTFKACFGAACRDLLVDHARRRSAERRGGNLQRQPLTTSIPWDAGKAHDVLEIDDALTALANEDPVLARVAELRVFGDLTIAECANVLALTPRTIDRKWAFARSWLHSRLQ